MHAHGHFPWVFMESSRIGYIDRSSPKTKILQISSSHVNLDPSNSTDLGPSCPVELELIKDFEIGELRATP